MTFLPMVSVALISQEPARGLGKFKWEPVYHGDSVRKSGIHAKTHDLRQVWGNSQRNPFIMAMTLFYDGDHAKTSDRLGEIHIGTRLSWRFREKKRELRQNRRLEDGLGKFERETVYLGDSPRKSSAYAKTGHLRPAWGNSKGKPLILAIAKPSEIKLAKPIGLAKPFRLVKPFGIAKPRELAALHLQNHLRPLLISKGTRYGGGDREASPTHRKTATRSAAWLTGVGDRGIIARRSSRQPGSRTAASRRSSTFHH